MRSADGEGTPAIERLLFVADSAVADIEDLPFAARAAFDAAAQVYVVTPSLPGRLAWLADDVDRFRHFADERLDAVLAHMDEIGARALFQCGCPAAGAGAFRHAVLPRPGLELRLGHRPADDREWQLLGRRAASWQRVHRRQMRHARHREQL